jgi:RNA polymerase sigma-70 factor (ECF subfamily)
LREEFEQEQKLKQFECLKGVLTAERGGIDYAEIARNIGMSEATARVAVHRLRKRFREVFREEIAHTVADPRDIDDEVRYLVGVLGE